MQRLCENPTPVEASFNVLSLLRYDGNFLDEKGNTVTLIGTPTINTSNPKFGTGAGSLNNGSHLQITSNQFVFPGDFTFETWVYLNALPAPGNSFLIFWTGLTDTDGRVQFGIDADGKIFVEEYFVGFRLYSASSIAINQWVHLAFSRNSGILRAFTQGNNIATGNDVNTTFGNTDGIKIGGFSDGSNSLNGLLDETRITKGLGRYTANFTPPSSAFSNN